MQSKRSIEIPELLRQCMYRGISYFGMGGTSDSRYTLGNMRLTHVVKQIFGIHRFVTHPERYSWKESYRLDDTPRGELLFIEIANELTNTPRDLWNELSRQVVNAYEQQQVLLAKDYPDGVVRLQRRIRLNERTRFVLSHLTQDYHSYGDAVGCDRYSALLTQMVLKAREDVDKMFELETDILTGWCRYEPGGYGEILLQRDTPIKDVLIAEPYLCDTGRRGLEQGEWLIMNPSPDGFMTMDASLTTMPPEVESFFLEQARKCSWRDLEDMALHNYKRRYRRLSLTTPAAPWEPAWYVRLAMRLAQWLAVKN